MDKSLPICAGSDGILCRDPSHLTKLVVEIENAIVVVKVCRNPRSTSNVTGTSFRGDDNLVRCSPRDSFWNRYKSHPPENCVVLEAHKDPARNTFD